VLLTVYFTLPRRLGTPIDKRSLTLTSRSALSASMATCQRHRQTAQFDGDRNEKVYEPIQNFNTRSLSFERRRLASPEYERRRRCGEVSSTSQQRRRNHRSNIRAGATGRAAADQRRSNEIGVVAADNGRAEMMLSHKLAYVAESRPLS